MTQYIPNAIHTSHHHIASTNQPKISLLLWREQVTSNERVTERCHWVGDGAQGTDDDDDLGVSMVLLPSMRVHSQA